LLRKLLYKLQGRCAIRESCSSAVKYYEDINYISLYKAIVLLLTLTDRLKVLGRTVTSNGLDHAPISLDNLVFSGWAVGLGVHEDIVVEVVSPRTRGPPTAQVLT
jgi:hypothetical protein